MSDMNEKRLTLTVGPMTIEIPFGLATPRRIQRAARLLRRMRADGDDGVGLDPRADVAVAMTIYGLDADDEHMRSAVEATAGAGRRGA
jgi:hypothetical protein